MRTVTINPVTRLEGHGKISIFLNDEGDVENAYFQVPELRGFEKFCEGRRVEEMPDITSRICGVCPEAHHLASTKTLDAVFHVDPPPTAKKIRELLYSAFYVADHTTHFYILAGPDFVMGPSAPKAERNILGVVSKVGVDVGTELSSPGWYRSALQLTLAALRVVGPHQIVLFDSDLVASAETAVRDENATIAVGEVEINGDAERTVLDELGRTVTVDGALTGDEKQRLE